jgi:hypothetical protein
MDGPEAGSRKKRECAVEQVRGRRFGSLIRIHRVGLNNFSAVLESMRNRGSQQRGRHSCASVLRCHDEATNGPQIRSVFRGCIRRWPEYLGCPQSRVTQPWFYCAPANRTSGPEGQDAGRRTRPKRRLQRFLTVIRG